MYCKYCHRFMNGTPDRCPHCGKKQADSLLKKGIIIVLRFYRGCLIATLSMALFAFIGSTLHIDRAGETVNAIFSLIMVFGSIAAAIFLELKIGYKKKFNPSIRVGSTPATGNRPLGQPKEVYAPKAPTAPVEVPAQVDAVSPPAPITETPEDIQRGERIKAEADAIVQGMREATIENLRVERAEKAPHPEEKATVESPKAKALPLSKIKSFGARVDKVDQYIENILRLASDNPDYDMSKKEIADADMLDEKIWKYDFNDSKVQLVPEPENPENANAIKVIVSGQHIGYIKVNSCVKILNKMKAGKIRGIDCDISGGPYKIVYEEYNGSKVVEHDTAKYSVHLTIYESVAE